MGTASDLLAMFSAARRLVGDSWQSSSDQALYSAWFVHTSRHPDAAPRIHLDHCQEVFATDRCGRVSS